MAGPTFKAAGSAVYTADSVVGATTLTPTPPTRAAGDLLVLITESIRPGSPCATPTGWALLGGGATAGSGFPVTSGTATGGRIYVFTRVATNDASDNPSVAWTALTTGTSGSSCGARILAYSNAAQGMDGIATATDTAATTSWTMPATTTTVANTLVIGVSVKVSDTNQTTTISNFTERTDDATQTGTGHITQVSEKAVASPGSSGTGTVTPSDTTSSRVLAVSFGLLAAVPAKISTTTTAVNDTFTGADGTALTSHTGETGATWTSHGSYTTGAKINTNRAEGESVSGLHYASGVPASADYIVEAVLRKVTTFSNATGGIAFRINTGADTYYSATWIDFIGTSSLQVARVVAGASTALWGIVDNPANGTDRTIRVEISGSLMSFYSDGTLIWQGTDGNIAAAGRVGVRMNLGTSTTGYHVDSIAAYDRTAISASATTSATLALTAPTLPPLSAASAVSSATLALTAQTTVSLGASSAQSSATLSVAAPMPVLLGAASAQSSATLNLSQYVPLSSSAAASSATLALTAKTAIPLGPSAAVSSATLALTDQTTVTLSASTVLVSATLALTAKTTIALGVSSAQSSASLNLAQYVSLSNSSAVSSATLVLGTSTTVPLAASSAISSATLTVTTGAATPLGASSATASSSLALSAPTQVPLTASSATATTALTVTTSAQVPLAASVASTSTTLALTAKTQIPLVSASATSSATLGVTAGASTVPLAVASSTASTTLALSAPTQIPLGASSAVASATLALTVKTTIALGASSAQSSATLAVSLPAPAIVGLETANVQASATLAASAKTAAILQSAGIQATATLALSAGTLVVLLASTASSSATLALTAPFFTPIPEWDQHTGTEWVGSTDSDWVSTPEAAEGALYPAADLYPDSELYPSRTVEGGDWEESSDEEWILA